MSDQKTETRHTHRVTLSNGETLEIEENNGDIHIYLVNEPYDYNPCICSISTAGVTVMPNSGDAVFTICKTTKKRSW